LEVQYLDLLDLAKCMEWNFGGVRSSLAYEARRYFVLQLGAQAGLIKKVVLQPFATTNIENQQLM